MDESGLPSRREKDASEAGKDGPVEEMGSKARVSGAQKIVVSLETIQALLGRNTNEAWTDKHRNATRKLVVEGGWVQTRLCDIVWSVEKDVSRL